jgi:uncharacterized membrane protein
VVKPLVGQERRAPALAHWLASPGLLWGAVAIGVILRVLEFVNDRSLWLDESFVALNITGRSFAGLFGPLSLAVSLPKGYLVLDKLFVTIFGQSEEAFRAVSFVSSLVALVAFVFLARRILAPTATLLAVALFAVSDSLLRFTSELKQYETDVAVTVLVLLFAVARLLPVEKPTIRDFLALAAVGPVAVFFSQPSLFMLASVGVVLSFRWIRNGRWHAAFGLVLVGVFWLVSLAAYYHASVQEERTGGLVGAWHPYFFPLPPHSGSDVSWLPRHLLRVFADPPGLMYATPKSLRASTTVVAALVFLVGCVSLARRQKAQVLALLLGPFFFALIASAIREYPFGNRLLLFVLPLLVLILAEGVWSIARRPGLVPTAAAALAVVALFANSVDAAVRHVVNPRKVEEIKPAMGYLRDHERAGDRLYLYYSAQYAFRVYARRYGFQGLLEGLPPVALPPTGAHGDEPVLRSKPPSFLVGTFSDDVKGYGSQIQALAGGGRTWILFSHVDAATLRFYLSRLDRLGHRLASFKRKGVFLYLYDLARG